MTAPLHVLVYGPIDAGVCDTYRFGIYQEPLARLGVEVRPFTRYNVSAPVHGRATDAELLADERAILDRSQIDWADVIVFRRFYTTRWSCRDCALVSPDAAVLRRHAFRARHGVARPDALVRPLFGALESNPELLRGRAIVYETDDDLLHLEAWNGVLARVRSETDVIERMARRADLVTCSTPVLADRLGAYNKAVRVIRNAIDPGWYPPTASERLPGNPRLLYYAKPNRMRDYDVCRRAVDELVRSTPDARRVWLGALGAPGGGSPDEAIGAVDEPLPYVEGVREFAEALVAAQPHIGLAPLVGDYFDRGKSELHWLEYSMAGAATVATRAEPGPFDVIRDGVDGFLAADRHEWLVALQKLAGSRDLREEIAGRAKERVLREYTVDRRAEEWAAAYQWAAEHAGRGARAATFALSSPEVARLSADARSGLAYRTSRRLRLERAADVLAALRDGREACWTDATGDPLVSVVVPVVDEPDALVARALASATGQTYERLEILVVASNDRLPGLLGLVSDSRLIAVPVPSRADSPPAEDGRSDAVGAALTAGIAAASGAWIAPLSPETMFTPDHVEVLLEVARENGLEFVYGQAEVDAGPDAQMTLGVWPPSPDGVLTAATELFAAPLLRLGGFDREAWREGESPGWSFWRLVVEAGARMAGIEYSVARLAPLEPAVASAPGARAGEGLAS